MRLAERLLSAVLLCSPGAPADCAPLEFVDDGIRRRSHPEHPMPIAAARSPRPPIAAIAPFATRSPSARPIRASMATSARPCTVSVRASTQPDCARIADPKRLDPNTVMPAYCSTDQRWRVARAQLGVPMLTAEEIEDVIAWLQTLDGRGS